MKTLKTEWYYVYVARISKGGDATNDLIVDLNTSNKTEAYDKFEEWVSDYCSTIRSDDYHITLMLNNNVIKNVYSLNH